MLTGYVECRPTLYIVRIEDGAVEKVGVGGTFVETNTDFNIKSTDIRIFTSSPLNKPSLKCVAIEEKERKPQAQTEGIETLKTKKSNIPLTYTQIGEEKKVILNVYGAYGYIDAPAYDPMIKVLIDRGWSSAYAHVRGGGILGNDWYQAGRAKLRINAISDLNECAMYLKDRFGCQVFLRAFSAGGLTAVAAMHSKEAKYLYSGALLMMPFVNPMAVLEQPHLAMSKFERDEYGEEEDVRKIDPCETITSVQHDLPPMHITYGEEDARVPADMVLKYVKLVRKYQPQCLIKVCKEEGGHYSSDSFKTSLDQLEFILTIRNEN